MAAPRHVLETYVRATPEQVWAALTDPALTEQFWFRTRATTTWMVGGRWALESAQGDEVIAGEVVECEPPHRLVVTFALVGDPELADDRPSRCAWTIDPDGDGCRVRLVHDDFHGVTATLSVSEAMWPRVLSSLKSLLETGSGLGLDPLSGERVTVDVDAEEHADWGRRTNRRCWELLDLEQRTAAQDRELRAVAYASAWHWSKGGTSLHEQRAEWLISRALVALGDGPGALAHAEGCWTITEANGLVDFDLAYAMEAMYRALRAVGRHEESGEWFDRAEAAAAGIADPDDRDWFLADLGR